MFASAIHKKKDLYKREGKGRRCCLGGVFECCTKLFSSKDDLEKIIWKNILGGWLGMV